MKKNLAIFALAVALVLSLAACHQATAPDKHTLVTGVAAKGAYLPAGSPVEVRAMPQGGVPSAVFTSTTSAAGTYTVDVDGASGPYLVRVQDPGTGHWYYSYSDGNNLTANVNPYSDLIIRYWYLDAYIPHGNPMNIDVDSVFTPGVYPPGTADANDDGDVIGVLPDNTPMSLPPASDLQAIASIAAKMVSHRYGVQLEDFLAGSWVAGQGYDALLDQFDVPGYLTPGVAWMCRAPDFLVDFDFYYTDATSMFHADVWTAYGASGVSVNWGDGSFFPLTLLGESGGIKHYSIDHKFVGSVITAGISEPDYRKAAYRTIALPAYHK